MSEVLTFVIPVRHQQNSKDWAMLKSNLEQTAKSIASQTHHAWKAIIVANEGADLPPLPDKFLVKRVGFPPNALHEQGTATSEQFLDSFRIDKGRRILEGLRSAGELRYVMIVDDDDFVSCRLTEFVAGHLGENGWSLHSGWVWAHGRLLYRSDDFHQICGTSHIVRADLYGYPEKLATMDDAFIREMLGSHTKIEKKLEADGSPLRALPFVGAIYRIGHPNAHSRSAGIFRKFFIRREVLSRPFSVLMRLARLRLRSRQIDGEFFGTRA